MSFRRTLTSLLAVLALAGAVQAQSYTLTEDSLVDSYFKIELDMKLSGTITVRQERATPDPKQKDPYEEHTLKQTATARHQFLERILEANKAGLADKSARLYQTAHADFMIDQDKSERSWRAQRRFLIVHRFKDQAFAYCPRGTLTREELELTEHFDTLALPGLLPGGAVKVGATWKPA